MRDEPSLRRLAEMGIDVYLPRAAMRARTAVPPVFAADVAAIAPLRQVESSNTSAAVAKEPAPAIEVLLLADVESTVAARLLADIARALRFARIVSAPAKMRDESAIGAASALVMFGDAQARAVGALLPADRQREMKWVVGAGLAALAVDAHAKRALWSELRRMTGGMAQARERTLAADAARGDHRAH
jgi:hypothetical protein